jgi:glycosyltransferase involved in cell wall biosynthesis
MKMPKLTTIILPAYNESLVIGRTLATLKKLEKLTPLQIIVACNGCSDSTAEIAKGFNVNVIEIEKAGKIGALNAACQMIQGDVVVFLDADLIIFPSDILDLINAINHTTCKLAIGTMQVDVTNSSILVKSFYKGWLFNPYFNNGKAGGVYAMSTPLIVNLIPFPDITNDDEWIYRNVPCQWISHVKSCVFIALAPRTMRNLLKVRMRVFRGNKELLSYCKPKLNQSRMNYLNAYINNLFKKPLHAPHFIFFALISIWLRIRYRLGWYDNEWGKDNSTRLSVE